MRTGLIHIHKHVTLSFELLHFTFPYTCMSHFVFAGFLRVHRCREVIWRGVGAGERSLRRVVTYRRGRYIFNGLR